MQYRDEAQLQQLRIRVDEELNQARADLETARAASAAEARMRDRLEETERKLVKLQRSKGLRRGRRRRAVLGLLLSERLLLDDLGFDSYADYAVAMDAKLPPDEAADANEAALARLALASDRDRLNDIERGVLDLDWLANGARELGVVAPEEASVRFSVMSGDGSGDTEADLDTWHNPYEAVPAAPLRRRTHEPPLPHLGEGTSPSDLPYWTESD